MSLDKISTKSLKKELKKRGIETTKQKKVSMYGVPIKDTCHMDKECGIIGLSCRNPSCPHI